MPARFFAIYTVLTLLVGNGYVKFVSHDLGMTLLPASLALSFPSSRHGYLVLLAITLAALTHTPLGFAADSAQPGTTSAADPRDQPEPRFPIYEFLVDGASLLPEGAVERAVNKYMGDQRTVGDVESARAALEKAYHDAGYLTTLVTIPEQKVDEGSVKLSVIEAPLQKSAVKGADFTLPSEIKARVPELAENKVPNFNKVQEQLAAVNASGNLRVTPVLRAGSLPGTVDVQLDVEDRPPLSGSVEINNRHSVGTTPTRVGANFRYDNLWQLGHSFTLGLQTAPERLEDARVISGTYVFPYNSAGNTATVYLVSSRSRLETLTGAPGLGLQGNSDTLGLRFNFKLGNGDNYQYLASLGADYKDLRQTLFANASGSQSTGSDTPVRYMPLAANVNANFFSETSRVTLDGTMTLGMGGLFGDDDAAFDARRKGATASFLALRTNLNYLQNFDRWAVATRATVQVTGQPLLPSEQMIAGGADTVRGYYEGERAGDYGLSGSIELRTPFMNPIKGKPEWRVGGVAFIDAGLVGTLKTATGSELHSLASAGVGLRWVAPYGLTLELDTAHAFLKGADKLTPAGENRIHARGILGF